MAFERYVQFVRRITPTVLLGTMGERLSGFLLGLLWDIYAQGASEAVLSPLLTRVEQPPDALPVIADERNLAKYIAENDLQWQARLQSAWEIWEKGGSLSLIEEQLAAAGYTGASVHSPLDWGRSPLDWPSQFWIFLPADAHDGIFGDASVCGVAVAGEHLCGISGPSERVAELRYIAQNFKAGEDVCRQILVEVGDAHVCGSGDLAGDSTICGGSGSVQAIGTGIPPT